MKDFYNANGYLKVEGIFAGEDLAEIRRLVDALIADPEHLPEGVTIGREGNTATDRDSTAAQNDSIRGAAFLVRFMPFFRDIARRANLLTCARGLLGPRVKVFRDQALFKPPGGQAKPPHQDQSYFRVQPADDLVTAWIALDDATLNNGCMHYVPGSHTHGVFPVGKDPDRPVHHVPEIGHLDLDLAEAVPCPAPAGSVIFHHGCTLHHSTENRSQTWRKALIFHYATSAARSENETLNEQVSLEID
jgi:ectoine hydroxylase-related dioxygenase (phytanoyl-CoA dioxygenase family)